MPIGNIAAMSFTAAARALLITLVAALPATAGAQPAPPTYLSSTFNSIMGVDADMGNTSSTYVFLYTNAGGTQCCQSGGPDQFGPAETYVKAEMDYLGFTRWRTGTPAANTFFLFQNYSGYGYSFTTDVEAVNATQMAANLALVAQINNQEFPLGSTVTHPNPPLKGNHITAVEGRNEISNNNPACWNGVIVTDPNTGQNSCTQGGITGLQGAELEQSNLYAQAHAMGCNHTICQVDYFTGWGGALGNGPDPLASPRRANFDNSHPYPDFGEPPYAWMTRTNALANGAATDPAVYTEIGYPACNNLPQCVFAAPQIVDETTQAKNTLLIPLDAALLGISHVFLFNMMNAFASDQAPNTASWGLFRYSAEGISNPLDTRPVAVALHNFNALFQDKGHVGALKPLNYTVSGLPTAGYCPYFAPGCAFTPSLAVQQSTGHYKLALWTEQEIWNATTDTEVAGTTYPVTLTFPAGAPSHIAVYDPLISASPIPTGTQSGQTFSLNVGPNEPLILDITP